MVGVLDTVVAQGCKPIGPVFSIEQVQRNVLLELNDGERKASPVSCLQRVLEALSDEERDRARHSLFLGIERRTLRLGRDGQQSDDERAFLVRNLIGVDPSNGAVAVAERVRPGQNVQFQLREATASRDEALQLLGEAAGTAPQFGLLMACLGRGQGLFGVPNGDVSLAREVMPSLPVAGAFCNGEIGPVGGATHLHGYTACWGLLRPVDAPSSLQHPLRPIRHHVHRALRQHVNPLSRFFQLPLQLPQPDLLFNRPEQPIHLDIGCARGRCVLGLAEQAPDWNHLGVEIRRPLVTAADRDALSSDHGNVRILFCNANISLEGWMAALPSDRLQRVSIQFPDPWFKRRHRKRRVLQPALVLAIAEHSNPVASSFCRAMCSM